MRILALDLGTKTGWALWDGRRIESGVQTFALERGESPGMRFIRFNRWLDGLLKQNGGALCAVELIAYEKPHHRGGAATEIACGFSTRVHEFCASHRIEFASVHSSTLKKFATGRGNAQKADMIQGALARWADQKLESDDQADALWVLQWAMTTFNHAPKRGLLGTL